MPKVNLTRRSSSTIGSCRELICCLVSWMSNSASSFKLILMWALLFYFMDSESLNTNRVPIPRTLSWTGWLLVLVYLGGLTAISAFVVHKLFLTLRNCFSMKYSWGSSFYRHHLYFLTSVHNGLEKRNWTERRKRVILQALAVVVFVIIDAVYMLFALGQYISLVLYPNDPTFKEL